MQILTGWGSYIARSRFVRDVVIVAGGTGLAQAITVAFSPIITRLYGPEAFGILGVFTAVAAVISQVASLAYAHAIVLPASDDDARALLRLSLLITVGFTALSAAVFGAFHHKIGNALRFGAASSYLLLVPVVVFCSAIAQALQQWLIRKKRFRSISGVEVAQATVIGASKSGVGLIAATAPILLVLNGIGYALRAVLTWLAARRTLVDQRELSRPAHGLVEGASLRTVAHMYRDFPFYRAPQLLLGSVSQSIPPMILAAGFGPSAAGFYALSIRVLHLPVLLVSDAIGKVFLPRIAEAAHCGEKLQPLILKATGGLALTGLLPFGMVIAFGPQLFGLVFGPEWVRAGDYARWLALWLYMWFVSTPCEKAIPILDLQSQRLVLSILGCVLSIGALFSGALGIVSDRAAVALYAIANGLIGFGIVVWATLRSGTRLRDGFEEGSKGSHR